MDAFRERGRVTRFERGTTLLHEGQLGDKVMVLLTGRVKVVCVTGAGREMVLRFCGPGELLGELAVLDGLPRSSTVVALTDVEVVVVGAESFRCFAEETPGAALMLLNLISRRFRDADRKRIEFGASDATGRVAARIAELADCHAAHSDRGLEILLPLSQEELAGWSGCSREAAAKALRSFRERGWVKTDRRHITVLDLDRLRRRAPH